MKYFSLLTNVNELRIGNDSSKNIGLGAQILRDLGVGKIRLLSAPIKYNALSGFDLEVVDFLAPIIE